MPTLRILTLLPLLLTASPSAAEITIDDELHRIQVEDARISPDGNRIVFVQSELDWDENKRLRKLVVVPWDGGEAVPFTAGPSDRRPRWSPDGTYIAFLRQAEKGDDEGEKGKTQVWMIRAAGGEAFQLTEHAEGVSSFEWSPKSDRIFFIAQDPREEEEKEEEKKGDDAVFVYEGPNGQTERNRWSNVWVKPIGSDEKARQLTHEKFLPSALAVAPDGDRLAVIFRRENTRNQGNLAEVAVIDAESGELRQLTRNETPESNVAWRPDGRALSVLAPDESTWELAQAKLYEVDLESGRLTLLSDGFDGALIDYRWADDGRGVTFVAAVRTTAGVYRFDLASRRATPLTGEAGMVTDATFSAGAARAAVIWEDPVHPPDVYALALGEAPSFERVSDLNPELREKASMRFEVTSWTSFDELTIEGILYLPGEEKTTRPMPFLLEIHGGPAGVWRQRWNPRHLFFTQAGYAILCPNVRGSTAYGDELLRGNLRDIGGGDYQDLMTGVDAMIERGIADPEQLAVRGWSYGGILGGWTITQTDRFKAASLGAMVSDWTSEYGQGFNYDVHRWYIGGTPWNEPQRYRRMSSITHIGQVTTPTLLLHGDADTTCTVEQSVNYFNALWERGVPTRLIRFPREGHGIREPRHLKLLYEQEIAWIEKYTRGIETTDVDGNDESDDPRR